MVFFRGCEFACQQNRSAFLKRKLLPLRIKKKVLNVFKNSDTIIKYANSCVQRIDNDNASNILYGMDPGIFEFKKNAGSNPVIEPDALQTEVTTPIAFAVHNNIAYVADQSEGDDDPTPIIKVVGFNFLF